VGEEIPPHRFIPIQNIMDTNSKIKYALLLTLFLTGCYSSKVANLYIDNLQFKNPRLLQRKMQTYYPCGYITIKMNKADSLLADSLFRVGKPN